MAHKLILVPVDGSQSSVDAVETAIVLAGVCEAALEFLYVVDLDGAFARAVSNKTHGGPSVLEEAVASGRRFLDQALEAVPPEIEAKARCISGNAAQAILRVRYEHQADMIVMGSRGLGNLKAALMGSVSHHVLGHAECPVVVVKAKNENHARG